MAAPTNVRVEAESLSTTRVRWSYSGSAALGIYSSTDGVSYSQIAVLDSIVTEYEDTGLSSATKYWYKISDDGGSTFSDIVTVITHSCANDVANPIGGDALPRVGDEVTPQDFNDLAAIVENRLIQFRSPDGRTCVACITDGALVIDCLNYDGCDNIEVEVDQDINSISLPNCDDSFIDINFIIPPNTTRGIGGWPRGMGFTGDEGFTSPISGGSSGRSINEFVNKALNVNSRSGKSKPGTGTSGTKAGGQSRTSGAGCTCTPGSNGELRIVACNMDGTRNPTNSLGCSNSNKGARLIACGGRAPYTWTFGGSLQGASSGANATVTPPANSGTGVAGDAYVLVNKFTASSGGFCENWTAQESHGCDDAVTGCSTGADFGGPSSIPCNNGDITLLSQLSCSQPGCCANVCAGTPQCAKMGCAGCSCTQLIQGGSTYMCDKRTAGMISNGCNPCGAQGGSSVTVTDALGTQTTIVMRA